VEGAVILEPGEAVGSRRDAKGGDLGLAKAATASIHERQQKRDQDQLDAGCEQDHALVAAESTATDAAEPASRTIPCFRSAADTFAAFLAANDRRESPGWGVRTTLLAGIALRTKLVAADAKLVDPAVQLASLLRDLALPGLEVGNADTIEGRHAIVQLPPDRGDVAFLRLELLE